MKNIVYIGKYNGIIGGIERFMQNSAGLLRRNGFAVHCFYTENGGKNQESFAASFDSIAKFSPEDPLLQSADMAITLSTLSITRSYLWHTAMTVFLRRQMHLFVQ